MVLYVVVVVAVAGVIEFMWPIVWVCWVFMASCVGGFMGGFLQQEGSEKEINK